jgi:hypothetical protein
VHYHGWLRVVAAEVQTVILRLLSERRDDLTADRRGRPRLRLLINGEARRVVSGRPVAENLP